MQYQLTFRSESNAHFLALVTWVHSNNQYSSAFLAMRAGLEMYNRVIPKLTFSSYLNTFHKLKFLILNKTSKS